MGRALAVQRDEMRRRRVMVFEAWSSGGTFADIGREFGLSPQRARQIVFKAVVDDGARSDRARKWFSVMSGDGHWLRRYDIGFARQRQQAPSAPCSSA
jgi:hypothetical protein